VQFVIPGKPHGHQRHRARVVRAGAKAFAQLYDTSRNREFKKKVQDAWNDATKSGEPFDPIGPIAITVEAVFHNTLPARKREPNRARWRLKKPDIDNIVKAIMDALNGLAYIDDAQVVILTAQKYEDQQGGEDRTVVTVDKVLAHMQPPR
jgi:Holliday junction resolvase RusA-like endonuclease